MPEPPDELLDPPPSSPLSSPPDELLGPTPELLDAVPELLPEERPDELPVPDEPPPSPVLPVVAVPPPHPTPTATAIHTVQRGFKGFIGCLVPRG